MAPKPETPVGPAAATRSQTQREVDSPNPKVEPETFSTSDLVGDISVGEALKQLMLGQAEIQRDIAALKQGRTDASLQIEELTQRLGRMEVTPQGDSTTAAPLEASPSPPAAARTRPSDDVRTRPSDDARVSSSAPNSSASVPTPAASIVTRSTSLNGAMSTSLHDLAATMEPNDQNDFRNLIGKYKSSLTKLDAASAVPPPSGNRSLVCKKETLGEFDGDPARLEHFLGRIQAIAHSNADPYWEPAVVCTIPQCLVGDAQVWHIGLAEADARQLSTVEAWCRIMRRRFPVNKTEQRQQARVREWNTSSETAMTYFFHKVQLYRHAFGTLYTDVALAQEIIAGLPVSMRALLRLPQDDVSLDTVQDALCDWEPTWREANSVPLAKTTPKDKKESATVESEPSAKVLTVPPTRPPRSDLRSSTAPNKPVAFSPPVSTSASVASLSATYDPTRVIPANGGQPRMYRRPDSSKVMKLARNCVKCSGQHFDFEHDHMLRAGQLNTIDSLTEDYPEVDESELDLQHF
ncbi:hypothetical protein CF326_g8095 [Tilletia indica]|nr:hypothetical protein CF326_g8095 [Tilletia indica]